MTQRRQRAGNLPVETTGLVGRRAELGQAQRLLGESRLVTLTGVGGVGKTRLALRAAYGAQPSLRDGAWWVELSPLRRGALLAHTIAEALSLADQTTRPMIEVVAEYLADRELLLVLDTCEHLADECALAVEALLAAAPGLRILVTSRRPLGIFPERLLTVAPLSLPEPGCEPVGDVGGEAGALLMARAAEAVSGFKVTAENRPDLVRLCRRLEGLPLAIELAAARLRELTVAELTDRLEDRFAVLGTTDEAVRDAEPPWHQALRTAIGWSHQLCTPAERLLWARLSVFAGTFDAETAQRVCADDLLPAPAVPGLLDTLVSNSVLAWLPTGGGERYRMLDTIREFGAFWLRALEEEDTLRRRHRDVFHELARQADAAWLGPDQFSWYDRMISEHDNVRLALEFSLSTPENHDALELAGSLWFFWHACGFPKEGQHYLERALALDPEPSLARNRALWVCGDVRADQGDLSGAAALAAECAAAAERAGDTAAADEAATLNLVLAVMRGDLARTMSLGEALIARQHGDGFSHPVAVARVCRSHALIAQGRYEAAIEEMEKLRVECDRHGERWQRAYLDLLRAKAESACGRPEAAQIYGKAALEAKCRLNDSLGTAMAIDALAEATVAAGQAETAAHLLGLGQQVWDSLGRAQMGIPQTIAARRACEQRVRDAVGDDVYQAAFAAGYATDVDSAIARTVHHTTGAESP